MKRRRRRPALTVDEVDLATVIELQVGVSEEDLRRTPGLEDELRTAWEAIGHALLPSPTCTDGDGEASGDEFRCPSGTRPWAFWYFALEVEVPATKRNQLKELKTRGLLLGPWEEPAAERYLRWLESRQDQSG